MAGLGKVGQGMDFMEGLGMVGQCLAGRGLVMSGMAGYGFQGLARLGWARLGEARQGRAWTTLFRSRKMVCNLIHPFDWSLRPPGDHLLTSHARRRMAERGITMDDIKKCLVDGYCYPKGKTFIYCLPKDDCEICVVVNHDGGTVVTVINSALHIYQPM